MGCAEKWGDFISTLIRAKKPHSFKLGAAFFRGDYFSTGKHE
jgi:hypothetical protein